MEGSAHPYDRDKTFGLAHIVLVITCLLSSNHKFNRDPEFY